ncbi:nucleoside transporter 2, putative (NT2) [Plasmodium ovale curtisi]|uniref:Nucleoside transporter 2, putative (NT2) n=1 Tax=Plasmodium ovale curtisi TaxID=864141 RepID=A0A1A8VP11_PLAOA|nr:nucleoside transporter 2, putative (NT2) [Plasmodium ovale curtisi]SBS82387.1 nucleoside transporter 2, putative (NT2) [Plasmodium ovale curtisi]
MSTPSEKGDTTHGGNNPHGSNHHEGDIIGRRGSVVREDIETETEKRIASIMENNSSSVFANVTLCLMGMSSVLLYNCFTFYRRATCSLMKTMIFSIATIVLSSSKVICLSYGLTGIYSLLITSTFFYFLIKIEKDIKKLIQSIFVTSCINCTFILTSFICYTLLKRTDDFKRKFKMYTEQRREKKDQKGEKGEKKQSQYVQHNTHDITIGITPTEKKEDTHCVFISIENTQNECQTIDPTHTLLSTMRDKVTLKKKDNLSTDVIHDNTDNNNAVMKNTCGQSTMEIDLLCGERISTGVTTQKQHFIKRFYKFNENRENLARQTRCILIFSNIYLNGWFVTLSFINIADVLKPLNTMSNVAIVSSFGSTLLRVGLLTGYGVSTIYKHIVGKI